MAAPSSVGEANLVAIRLKLQKSSTLTWFPDVSLKVASALLRVATASFVGHLERGRVRGQSHGQTVPQLVLQHRVVLDQPRRPRPERFRPVRLQGDDGLIGGFMEVTTSRLSRLQILHNISNCSFPEYIPLLDIKGVHYFFIP